MSRTIITIGTQIPGHSDLFVEYSSGKSLHDDDIVLFNTAFPYYQSEGFSGGSSALSETASQEIQKDIAHWIKELDNAIADGKTVFIMLAAVENQSIRTGYKEYKAKTTIHSVANINNYSALPFHISPINGTGKRIKTVDSRFKQLYEVLKPYMEYEVYLPAKGVGTQIYTTVSGTYTLGSILKIKDKPGNVILLPAFELGDLTTEKDGKSLWSKAGMGVGQRLIHQLVEIDKTLRKEASATPTPQWVSTMPRSSKAVEISTRIQKIETTIEKKTAEREKNVAELSEVESIQALLYENGTPLEEAIEVALKLMGYQVSNFRDGSLEIDHVIISPTGKRLIGEAEGKDSSAIDISKFRQLESNIGEDFERDEVAEPAKGVLFGNGNRLVAPSERSSDFTDKCMINAKRLGTSLVKTSDMYTVALYLIDHPTNESYKAECREVIESTSGDIVKFPNIPA